MGKRKVVHGPGKTREEMVREARAAYKRRDEEMAQRKEQVVRNHADAPAEGARRGERSWWEAAGVDGGAETSMSPLAEEASNPMEDIAVPSPDEDSEKLDTEHSEDIAVPGTSRSNGI